jgi:probable rRNA maturation factor
MPEPLVGTVIEDPRWADAGLEAIAERAARATLAAAGRDPDRHEISLLGCDDARIALLNASFRGKATPTNVLSWPAFHGDVPDQVADEPFFLGDIALAYDTCDREARSAGISLADHSAHLVVHGVLHLLGHDHVADDAAEAMQKIETNILASIGIPNPYSG